VRGVPMQVAGINASSDIAYLASKTAMSVAINGLARFGETRNHGSNERCRIEDLLALTKTVAAVVATGW
jgi:hypothetical protein